MIVADLAGKTFGHWTVIRNDTQKVGYRWCRCACGTEKYVLLSTLRKGTSRSCGCSWQYPTQQPGTRYGRWRVIKEDTPRQNRHGRPIPMCLCRCECGTVRSVRLGNLVEGTSSSCGCARTETIALPEGVAARNHILARYRSAARRRGLSFNLTNQQVVQLISSKCYYCGAEPFARVAYYKGAASVYYNGIDRKNSAIGYEPDNCVTACKLCNYAKRETPFEEFCAWIKRIHENGLKEGFIR